MRFSNPIIHGADNLCARIVLYDFDFTEVKLYDKDDEYGPGFSLFFSKPCHARKAQRLADAINAVMRDPIEVIDDDLRQWENLLACWQSGQISASQWQAHCEDPAFAAWVSAKLDANIKVTE